MFWNKEKRITKLKIEIAGVSAKLDILHSIHLPGRPNVRSEWMTDEIIDLSSKKARLAEEIRLLELSTKKLS